MSNEQERGEPTFYDFKRYFGHELARSGKIEPFLEDDNFIVTATRVVPGNEYIQEGGTPTGKRDIELSLEITINHKSNPSSGGVILRREDTEDGAFLPEYNS